MKIDFVPKTRLGKWSVGLNAFFLIAVVTSYALFLMLKILNFDDYWWDMTVVVAFPASIIALIIGIIAVRKDRERSVLVNISIFVGACAVLFILLHSLFIND
jgi:hypothetical protein